MSASFHSTSPKELNILVEITQTLTSNLPFIEKCESALQLLADFTDSDIVSLREFSPENSSFDLIAYSSSLIPQEDFRVTVSVANSLSAIAMAENSPVVVNDYPAHDRTNQRYTTMGMNSALAVPVYINGELFATLGFGSKSLNHYDERKVEVVSAISSVVGVMIANAELQEANEVEASIGRIISTAPVGVDFFEKFTTEVRKVIDFDRVTLNSVDLKANTFVTEFLFGNQIPNFPVGETRDVGGTVLEEVIRSRTGQCFRFDTDDNRESKFPRAKPFLFDGQPYFLSVPLIVGDQLIGTMGIIRGSVPFSQKNLTRATRLGNLVAGVFSDYKQKEFRTQAEREIDRNKAILEAEAAIGRILSAPLDKSGASEDLTMELVKIIPLDRHVILSVDLEAETFTQEFSEFVYHPDMIVANNPGQTYVGSITGEVIRTKVAQSINSDDPRLASGDMPITKMVFDQGYTSLVVVPLEFESRIIGTFACARKSGEFREEDVFAASRIGTLLAGALATFRITEERDRAWAARSEIEKRHSAVLEAEANIGRVLSSPLSRARGIEALRTEITRVIATDRILITSIDMEAGTFSQEFDHFLDFSELKLANNIGKSYSGTITEEVLRTGKGRVLNFDDPLLKAGHFPLTQAAFERGFRSIMVVPVEYEEKIIGVLGFFNRQDHYNDEDLAVANRMAALVGGALATFKISAERDRAQVALSESDGRFRQIADSIGGVFWLVELAPHRLIYASPNADSVWDMPLAEIYDDFSLIFRNIHPEDTARIQRDSIEANKTGFLDIEYRIIKRDGSVRSIRSRGFPVLGPEGEILRMSGFAEDVTEHNMELERITEAGRLLSVGELASGVAHEINNPLAAINLYTEALLEQDLTVSVADDIKIISAQGKRAAGIVRNLLQFSRKSSYEVTTVRADDFIESCVDLKRHDFRVNNITNSISVLLDQPEISIDKQLMTQVMVNILSNAEQACSAAQRGGHISISVREADGSTRISISDDGPGIPTDVLSKVFDPFFTTKEVGEGTGLGLSVSYGIITQLGGQLWVESDGASGTTFHIDVPRNPAGQLDELKPIEPPGGDFLDVDGLPESKSSLVTHVLVVDDEQDLREVVAKVLERRGYTAEQAADGEEAWSKLLEGSYDCILLDLRMPGLSGQELFRRIAVSDPETAAKVVFITGDLDTRAFLEPLDNRVLIKPLAVQDLEAAIELVTSARPDRA